MVLLQKSPDFFVWASIIYDGFGVNRYIVPKKKHIYEEIFINERNHGRSKRAHRIEKITKGISCETPLVSD